MKNCHKMKGGILMTGKVHTSTSKPAKKCDCKSKGMKPGSCKKSNKTKVTQMLGTSSRVNNKKY